MPTDHRGRCKSVLRVTVSFAGLALLTACAGGSKVATGPSTDYYLSHAAGNYTPPGPPDDPWGPYIKIAAGRFDVPEQWVRQVMKVESGGHQYIGGQLTVSSSGAMGLMQLEPETY
ncbi:MAG: transglycosylase SLT domain-containing protein, partial [Acidocella sp.]|nr:transglycosylase SLT domain-containing protein [Acidocella sp.]